ncbi:MAG: hypothetical protein GWN30_08935, partial [Gammaproteobacteria bacterium]|nr:hypothetical protein [Gammaproteobacteria bacterium]
MDSPLAFAENLAVDTGRLLLEFFTPNGTSSSLKEDYSIVTEADLSADNLITQTIQNSYPSDSLISEESQTT